MNPRPVPVDIDGPYRRPSLLRRAWWFLEGVCDGMDAAALLSVAVLLVLGCLGAVHVIVSIVEAAP